MYTAHECVHTCAFVCAQAIVCTCETERERRRGGGREGERERGRKGGVVEWARRLYKYPAVQVLAVKAAR